MTVPKFTAQLSLNSKYRQSFHEPSLLSERRERVIPAAPYWGDFRREECIRVNDYSGHIIPVRVYSSILWGSSNWEYDCRHTPARITNADGITRTFYADGISGCCDKQIFNMWGIFYVPESSCTTGPRYANC